MTTFDHDFLKTMAAFEKAGLEHSQALVITTAIAETAHFAISRDDLARKVDIDALRMETRDGSNALRMEMKGDIHREIGTLRSELRWALGFFVVFILAMAGKLFGIV